MVKRKALDALDIAAMVEAGRGDAKTRTIDIPLNPDKLTSVIAVANLKGGVGKSTIAVNLACELAGNQTVALVDADAQATATTWASRGNLPIKVEAMPIDSESDVNPWIDRLLNLEADHIVIDCPPHVGPATSAALGIADVALLPVTPSAADLVAANTALSALHDTQKARQDDGPLCLLVPSKVDKRTAAGREIEAALEKFGEPVGPMIRQRAAMVDAFGVGAWIGDFAPNSDALEDIQALAEAVKRRWLVELKRGEPERIRTCGHRGVYCRRRGS